MSDTAPDLRPRSSTKDLVTVAIYDERIIYDSRNGRAHHLNSTLTWMWQRCDGSRSVEELAATIEQETGATDMVGLISRGLALLAKADLLEPDSFNPSLVPKRSRRRSTIEEPRIMSITTPKGRRESLTMAKWMSIATTNQ
jgi:hypothetical protein